MNGKEKIPVFASTVNEFSYQKIFQFIQNRIEMSGRARSNSLGAGGPLVLIPVVGRQEQAWQVVQDQL